MKGKHENGRERREVKKGKREAMREGKTEVRKHRHVRQLTEAP